MKYLIFIILFFLFFGFSYFQLRNSDFKKIVKYITSGLVAMLLTPLLFWLISNVYSEHEIFSNQKEFNSVVWKNNNNSRHLMSEDIINNETFKGLKKSDVLASFGEPDVKSDSIWIYYIEYQNGLLYELSRLNIKFKNDLTDQIFIEKE